MNLFILLAPAALAAAVSYALTPVAAWVACAVGAMDAPGPRKVHQHPIPRLGGLAVIAAVLIVGGPTCWYLMVHGKPLGGGLWLGGLLLGLIPIVSVSFIDDVRTLRAAPKFLLHLLGAAIAVWFGVSLNSELHLFGHTIAVGFLAAPLSVIWLVGVTNAFNIVDGLDGLSAGLALISAMSLAGVFLLAGQSGTATAVLVLAGSLVGFLPRNIYPAQIFMGDTGATAIGFCLAALALKGGSTLSAGFATLLPVFTLGMPVAETAISMARRILRRVERHDAGGVFDADRNHMHHRLLALGVNHPNAVFILYAAGATLAGGALLSMYMTARAASLLLMAFLLAGVLGVRRLGYDEFALIRNGIALRVYEAPVLKKSMFVVFMDLVNVACGVYCAVALKTDDWNLAHHRTAAVTMAAVAAPISVATFSRLGLYKGSWRLADVEDFTRACGATIVGAALALVAESLLWPAEVSISSFAIYAMAAMVLVIGSRASYQVLATMQRRASTDGEPVVIYGAGRRGAAALRQLLFNQSTGLRPVAFIDDDPEKLGRVLNGVPIAGSVHGLSDVLEQFAARAVIVASEAIDDGRVALVRQVCDRAGVSVLRMHVRFDGVNEQAPVTAPAALAAPVRAAVSAVRAYGRVAAPSAPMHLVSTTTKCPKCRCAGLSRSHSRSPLERVRKRVTSRRLHRCEACGWHGWIEPDERVALEPLTVVTAPFALPESIDAVLR